MILDGSSEWSTTRTGTVGWHGAVLLRAGRWRRMSIGEVSLTGRLICADDEQIAIVVEHLPRHPS